MNAAIRTVERKRLEAEPRQLDALLAFAARAYRRPLTPAERDDLRGLLSFAAREERLDARRGDARSHRQRADVAALQLFSRGGPPPRSGRFACGAPAPRAAARPWRRSHSAAVGSCARQQAELLPLVEHARRRAVGASGGRRAAQRIGAAGPGAPDAEGRARAPSRNRVRRQLARLPALRRAQRGRSRALPRVQQRAARRDVRGADPVHHRRRPQRSLGARHAVRQPHVRESRTGQTLRDAGGARLGRPMGAHRQRARRISAAVCFRWRRS